MAGIRRILASRRRSVCCAAILAAVAAETGCGAEEGGAPRTLTPEAEEIEQLSLLGYVSGSQPVPEKSGVVRHDRSRVSPGLNFYVSGDEAGAVLMDSEGRVQHRWQTTFREIWPKRKLRRRYENKEWFRRAHLFENGDVLGIFAGGAGLVRLDRDSKILWSRGLWVHHDLQVMADGRIYTLSTRGRRIPRVDPEKYVLEDFVTVLDASGKTLQSMSLLEAFERSERYRDLWLRRPKICPHGSLMHANTVEVLDGRIAERVPEFSAGRVLVSLRSQDTIAVVDLELGEVVWAQQGPFAEQHDPGVLDTGTLLVFNNFHERGASRVEEYDPAGMQLVWSYAGNAAEPFFTEHSGAAQRLPNGNTLITESASGRAFEVTRDGEIVWEFLNPHRAGKQDELIATLYEMLRLPAEFDVSWANAPARL